jgi:ABC-type branched-subunit amino acid transport system permease subunit
MHADIQLLILGAAAGTLYALFASGLIIIFRSSLVLNFGHGAVATVGTYSYLWLFNSEKWPLIPAMVGGIAAAVAVGVTFDYVFMRKLRNADPLAKLVCTLGLLVTIQAVIHPIFGDSDPVPVDYLPSHTVKLGFGHPSFFVSSDRLILIAITIGICLALWVLYTFTRFGRATRAAADSERSSQLLGISPTRLELINWGLGSGLAGLAGILLSSIQQPTLNGYTQILVTAIAIALVANFRSFGLLVVAGLILGGCNALLLRYSQNLADATHVPGWDQALPLLVIIGAVVLGGRSVVPRGGEIKRGLPRARMPRRPGLWAVVALVIGVIWYLVIPIGLVDPTSVSLITAIVLMSLVVVTGYCGQISLGQLTMAAVGAWGAGEFLQHVIGLNPLLALLLGGLAAVPFGLIVGLPAVRVRGVNLAVVTLSVAVVLQATIFQSRQLTGSDLGLKFPAASLFGLNMNGLSEQRRFGVFVLVITTLVGVGIILLRRSSLGARFLAVRANERGAAASGLSVARIKLLGFVISAFIAGIAGVLLGFRSQQLSWGAFDFFTSITLVSVLYLGGVTSVSGALFGGVLLANGGIASHLLSFSGNAQTIVNLASGIGVMSVVVQHPDGLADLPRRMFAAADKRWRHRDDSPGGAIDPAVPDVTRPAVVPVAQAVR